MGENVINIADHRKPKAEVKAWVFDLRVWATENGPEALVLEFNDQDGLEATARLRVFAGMLDQLHYFMMQQAHHLQPNDDGQILAKMSVFENSRVRLRVNDDMIVTEAQEAWLRERFDDAKEIVNTERLSSPRPQHGGGAE